MIDLGKEKRYDKKKKKRFVIKEEQSLRLFNEILILVDTKTGINYLMASGLGQSGITPLLDSKGNIVVDR